MTPNETESGLPIVSKELLETILREPDKDALMKTAYERLEEENPQLFNIAANYASESKDPEKVVLCAIIMYYALDKQAYSNQMEKQM
jgi:hypothetical protein